MANGLSRKLVTPATLLSALLLATQFGLAPSAFADDDDAASKRARTRTNYRSTSRSGSGTRSERERTPSSSRYYDRSSRSTTDSSSSTDAVSKESSSRYADRASRSQYQSAEDRYSGSRPTTGSSGSSNSSGSTTGSASISEVQFRILEDKLLDEVSNKLLQERAKINAVAQAVSPMTGDVNDLKGRVTLLENHSPSGQITNQINTLNQQVSNIKKVINTIPGISI